MCLCLGMLKELSEYIEHEVYGLPFRRWARRSPTDRNRRRLGRNRLQEESAMLPLKNKPST